MRINRGVLGWGVFFVVVGLVPLAVRAGYVDADTVRRAWELWPLILIGIGLGLVLQRTPLAMAGGLLVAITFGLMGGSALAVGFGPVASFGGCSFGAGSPDGRAFPTQSGTLGDAADVSLDLSCGELTAATGAGLAWQLNGSSSDGSPPDISTSGGGLDIRTPNGGPFNARGGSWQITLPQDPAIRLDVSVNAGSARLDLGQANVVDLGLDVNAGDAHVNLAGTPAIGRLTSQVNAGSLSVALPSPTGLLSGDLSANAGSIEICVPDGVPLRIRTGNSPLGANNFGSRGLTQNGNVWTNAAFGSGATGIDLSTSANLGAVNLNPEAGCD